MSLLAVFILFGGLSVLLAIQARELGAIRRYEEAEKNETTKKTSL